MACIVYRKGKGTIEHGIECESTTCEVNELHSLLNDGWSQNPPGYVPPEPVPVEEQDLDSTITGRAIGGSAGNVLQPEVDRLTAEVETLNEQIDGLNEQLELREGIETYLNTTIAKMAADLDTARQIEDRLNGELSKARKQVEPSADPVSTEEGEEEQEAEEMNPTRAAGRDARIEGWETMNLNSLKKAIKDKAQEA